MSGNECCLVKGKFTICVKGKKKDPNYAGDTNEIEKSKDVSVGNNVGIINP